MDLVYLLAQKPGQENIVSLFLLDFSRCLAPNLTRRGFISDVSAGTSVAVKRRARSDGDFASRDGLKSRCKPRGSIF